MPHGDVERRRDDLAGLADLVLVVDPAGVHDRARRAERRAEGLLEVADHGPVLGPLDAAAAGDDDVRLGDVELLATRRSRRAATFARGATSPISSASTRGSRRRRPPPRGTRSAASSRPGASRRRSRLRRAPCRSRPGASATSRSPSTRSSMTSASADTSLRAAKRGATSLPMPVAAMRTASGALLLRRERRARRRSPCCCREPGRRGRRRRRSPAPYLPSSCGERGHALARRAPRRPARRRELARERQRLEGGLPDLAVALFDEDEEFHG